MSDTIRVNRVVNLLATNNTALRFHRPLLVNTLSDMSVSISLRDLTRLWPRIENHLVARGLFAVRPIGMLSYGVMASTNPLLGYLSLNNREKHIVTRMRNDRAGRVLQAIAAGGGEVGVLANGQLERITAYLDAYDHSATSTWELDRAAFAAMRAIPFGTFRSDRNYINNSNGQVMA